MIGAAGTPLTPPANQLQPADGNYDQQRFINEPSTFKYDIYSGTIEWNLGWGTLTSITGYGTTDREPVLRRDLDPGSRSWASATAMLVESLSASGNQCRMAETDDVNVKKFTQEVRLASREGQTLEWQVGPFYTREASTLAETLPSFIIPTLAPTGLPFARGLQISMRSIASGPRSGRSPTTSTRHSTCRSAAAGRRTSSPQTTVDRRLCWSSPPHDDRSEPRPAPTSSTRSRRAGT